jgi:serine/threonine protein kinase
MARDAETGMAFAIKYMRRECTDMDLKGLAENEMKIMSALNHPNIISVKEFNEGVIEKVSGEKLPVIYIVLELAMGGEMFDYVAITQCFADEVARYYFHQLIDALQYLHGKGICHRDLKAENLLLNEIYKLKLADFGFSVALRGRDDSGFLHTYKGTEGYMAPEIEEGKPYQGEKVDIFAAGVILFILIAELPPFESAILKDQCYQKIYKGDYDSFWEFHKYLKENPDFYKPDFMNLINALLAKDPAKRPTLAEIMSHPWQGSK